MSDDTQSCDTTLIKMCDDDFSYDAIKTEVIETSKDPLKIEKTGKQILNYLNLYVEYQKIKGNK